MKKTLAILLFALFSVNALAQTPNEVVQSAVDELAAALDGRKEELRADTEALRQLVDDILLPRFDRRYAAQLVLGRNWRNASEEQRDGFINVFYRALRNTYADGVLEFNEDRIEILPFRGDLEKPRTNVRTMVTLDDGTKVPVNYGLVRRDSGWMMFDVTIEGISYVRNYRAEINSEIQATSLDAVISQTRKGSFGRLMSGYEFKELGDGKFSLTGSMTFTTAGQILRESEDMFEKHTLLSVDLSGVDDTDSAGLALLLEWITWANHTVREIRFEGMPEKIHAIAVTTEVESLLKRGERWVGFIEAPTE